MDQTSLTKRFTEAEALRRKFDGCETMGGLAKASGANFEDMKFIKPGTIPEPTRSMLLSAKDGDMLPPSTTKAGIEVYAVCGRRSASANDKQRSKSRKSCSTSNSTSWPSAICAISGRTRTSNFDEQCDIAPSLLTSPDPALPLAVTMGDPAGIGPDITLASWHERRRQDCPPFAVYGDACSQHARAQLGLDVPIAAIASLRDASRHLCGRAARAPPRSAADGPKQMPPIVAGDREQRPPSLAGEALALVTNPIAKTLRAMALAYPGHTEFLADLRRDTRSPVPPDDDAGGRRAQSRAGHRAYPLVGRAGTLSTALIATTIRTTAAALAQDFGIPRPRIAVAGLNPHAGEDGLIGTEEAELIAPAIAELVAAGIAVTGPHSADTLFHAEARSAYDAVVAMYHDQALIPLKTLAFDRGVNVTLGLPFVRTSPDHGTAFALAGTGKARPDSFIAALRLAAELGKRRAAAAPRHGRRESASPDGLPPLGEVMRTLQLSARKSLGQHFILDLNLTRRIARAAGPLAGKTVVEIGPGRAG